MAWVYILKGNRYYIGSTSNLLQRLKKHRQGHTPTTKRIGEWVLVWKKEYSSIEEARLIERQIKKWKSSKRITRLIKDEEGV